VGARSPRQVSLGDNDAKKKEQREEKRTNNLFDNLVTPSCLDFWEEFLAGPRWGPRGGGAPPTKTNQNKKKRFTGMGKEARHWPTGSEASVQRERVRREGRLSRKGVRGGLGREAFPVFSFRDSDGGEKTQEERGKKRGHRGRGGGNQIRPVSPLVQQRMGVFLFPRFEFGWLKTNKQAAAREVSCNYTP